MHENIRDRYPAGTGESAAAGDHIKETQPAAQDVDQRQPEVEDTGEYDQFGPARMSLSAA
ncbi:MAG: hypothetical protein ACM359_00355 [Bacillota bacterium]